MRCQSRHGNEMEGGKGEPLREIAMGQEMGPSFLEDDLTLLG